MELWQGMDSISYTHIFKINQFIDRSISHLFYHLPEVTSFIPLPSNRLLAQLMLFDLAPFYFIEQHGGQL